MASPLTTRAVEKLVKKGAHRIGLYAAVVVHSLRVAAQTPARERGVDIIYLQEFAGYVAVSITGRMESPTTC